MRSRLSITIAAVAGLVLMVSARPQNPADAQGQAQQQPANNGSSTFTLKVNSDLVLTNIVVRDKKTGEW